MKVKQLIVMLQEVNPEAEVLVQSSLTWEEGKLMVVETDPASTKEVTELVKLIAKF